MLHAPRGIETDLVTALTMLSGYRQARWRAVILYGLAGIGKTAIAQAVVDNAWIQRIFRDGCVWLDGSREPEEEVMRLCLALGLERTPGERWVACWRRWAGAVERRLLLIIDDAISAEGLPPFIAGLGSQVVVLIATQQGAEIRAEVERWLPARAIMPVGVAGLTPAEGRQLVEAVVGRPLADEDWGIVQEVGELVGWHPEALRLAAIQGRDSGWQGVLGDLQASHLPWIEVKRLVMRQWARLQPDQQAWLAALISALRSHVWYAGAAAAQAWQVDAASADRRLWLLKHGGLVTKEVAEGPDSAQWRVAPVVCLALSEDVQ